MSNRSQTTEAANFDSRAYCKGQIPQFKIGVFGSRSLTDERVEIIITETAREHNATHIVTCQEPQGVSEVAQATAKKWGYILICHFLNMRYMRGAFEQRSKEIVKDCDFFLIIHDGKSKGTANELELVKKSGKLYRYEQLDPTEYDRSVGFNIEQMWGSDSGLNMDSDLDDVFKKEGAKAQ